MTKPRYDGIQKCPCCEHEFDPTMHVERVNVAELGEYMDRKDGEREPPSLLRKLLDRLFA